MLIALLKEKRYKKLDEIQQHMSRQGLQTTVAVLRKMVDEIKVKNAQRKAQLGEQPNQ